MAKINLPVGTFEQVYSAISQAFGSIERRIDPLVVTTAPSAKAKVFDGILGDIRYLSNTTTTRTFIKGTDKDKDPIWHEILTATVQQFTEDSIPYINDVGQLTQDNTNFKYDPGTTTLTVTTLSAGTLALTGLAASRLLATDSSKNAASVSNLATWIAAGEGITFADDGDGTGTIGTDGALEDLNTLGAAASDGQVIVATGSGAFAYESGATLRTSVGVGTGDSPTLTALTLSISTGTAPLTISSTTKVANLNVDLLDDQSGAYYCDSAHWTGTSAADLTDGGDTTLHGHNHDGLTNFVGDEHIAHSGVTFSAGTGLTGGGTLAASRSFAVTGVLEDLVTTGVVGANSEFLVGTGEGAMSWENAATAASSLGLGTGNSPTFTGLVLSADIDLNGANIDDMGVIFMREQSAADADVTAQGQLWVKTATPNQLWFTDDAGTDFQLGVAGGGGAPTDATYIVQTADGDLGNEQAMGALGSGLVFNTTTTGVQSIATISTGLTLSTSTLTTNDGEIVHDNLSGFVANEHLDWTNASAAFVTSSTGSFGGDVDMNDNDLDAVGVIFLKEQADANADVAAYGQLWVNLATPNELYFTTDTGADREIAYAGGAFHDGLSDFVADEHVAHGGVTLTAGTGLSGGGTIASSRTFNVDGVLADLVTTGVVGANSEFLVGTGSGAMAWESGDTVRTSLGLALGTDVTAFDFLLDDIADLTDPGADRILFWDDSAGIMTWLTISTGLATSTTNLSTNDSAIVHDNLSGFVANEHINHTSVTFSVGAGLTGGGTLAANRTFAVDRVLEDIDTLGPNAADSEFLVGTAAGAFAWEAGATVRTSLGLTIGTDVQAFDFLLDDIADLADPGADRILFWDESSNIAQWLSVGTGMAITTTTIATDDGAIVHDDLSGFVTAEHVSHTAVTFSVGAGLTGGGDLSSNRTFAVDRVLEDIDTLGPNAANSEIMVGTGAGALAWESGATLRTSIGVAIGSDVQAHGDILDDLNTLGAAASDGQFLVATGAGVFAYESTTTARTSLGVGTGDSPTLTGLTLSANLVMGDASVTGVDTITFTDTAGTIAGIQNQNLLDKSATETVAGAYTFSANMGIGGPRTEGTLHVIQGSAGTVTANVNTDDLVVEVSGNGGASVLVPDLSTARWTLGAASDSLGAQFGWQHSNALMFLGTSLANATVQIKTAGNVLAATFDENQNLTLVGDLRVTGGDIGTASDTNLIGLASSQVSIRGALDIGTVSSYSGELLAVTASTSAGMGIENTGSGAVDVFLDANRSGASQAIGRIRGMWDGTEVASMWLYSGDDTVNKDNGFIQMRCSNTGADILVATFGQDGGVHVPHQSTPPTALNNQACIYGKNVSASAELFCADEAGNDTQLSPHDLEGWWYLNSYSATKDMTLVAQMEAILDWMVSELGLPQKYVQRFRGNQTGEAHGRPV